jgi:signal transduction histidine kinase/ligand-binding sensor domain-containing protein
LFSLIANYKEYLDFMRILALVVLLFGARFAWSEGALSHSPDVFSSARPPLRFFGEREGLPNSTVYSLMEDRRGRLWAATQDGVARHSGRAWVTLNLPPERLTNFVRTLLETPDGAFWFATETGGLWRLHRGQWSHFDKAGGFPSDRINALHLEEEPGAPYSLYVGTSAGIARFRAGVWSYTGPESGLPSTWVWRFSRLAGLDGRSRLLAATFSGFLELAGDAWVPYREIPGLEHHEVNDIREVRHPDGHREWWISAWGRGLLRWDGRKLELLDPARGFPSRFPVTLCTTQDKEGHPIIWAGTFDSGLVWISRGTVHVLDTDRGLPSDGIYSLLAPASGRPTIWVGFRGGGLASLDLSGWHGLDRQTGLPADEVRAFAETRGGRGESIPWVATSRGIVHFSNGRWRTEGRKEGLPADRIESLCASLDGKSLWAGTQGGLAKRGEGRWRVVPLGVSLKDSRVLCLRETRDEGGQAVLWAGTESGLVRLDASGSRLFTTADGLPSNLIYALLETRDEAGERTLWVGTRGGGVAALQKGRWRCFGQAEGIPNLGVFALQEHHTEDGRRWIWAGTFGGGVARLDLANLASRWEVFNTKNLPGLPSDTVVRIETHGERRLYLSTQRGVVRLSFGQGAEAARPREVEVFTPGDGLSPVSTSYGASMVDRAGRIWVATYRGAAIFDPAAELPPPPVAVLNLDGIRVAENYRSGHEGLDFKHWERPLLFEFGLVSHHREEDNRYQTQLLGDEQEPTPWGPEGRRELTALASGRYILRIWAKDYRGRISGPLDVPLRIRPAPWASPWAYLCYGLSGAGLLFLAHRLRLRILQQRNRILQARIQEATAELARMNEDKSHFMALAAHDLRSPLNAILLSAETLAEGSTEAVDFPRSVDRIQRAAQQMNTLIGNLVETNLIETGHLKLNPGHFDLRTLAAEAQVRLQDRAEAKGLRLELATTWEELPVRVDSGYLQQVLDNLLTNAIKFTPPGPPERLILIRVSRRGEQAQLEVQDQGPGFTAEDKAKAFGRFMRLSARPTAGEESTGLGLSIVKSLVEAMGGTVGLESEPGKGATFVVRLPLVPPEHEPSAH